MKEVFHRYLLRDFKFDDYEKHLKTQCLKFDQDFNKKVKNDPKNKMSGSCAVTLLVMGKKFNLAEIFKN